MSPKTGNKSPATLRLDKGVFGVEVSSHDLLKRAYLYYLANSRTNLAKTKTRGLVQGGGAKPYRQKGTGRSRVGSSRTPIWRGGGIIFGPTGDENYEKKLNTTQKRQALRQALSMANKEDRIKVIEELPNKQAKTKEFIKFLAKIEVSGRLLIVMSQKEKKCYFIKS